ncbi:hypothetical protein [Archangium lipolyticum]|uniref:hypothetical protein n=1 Tax=Archangium lipolyticum TaxID=2970465 RepID=UPI00214A6694|nr:hypothetical protein [Archangium lipolyticum]
MSTRRVRPCPAGARRRHGWDVLALAVLVLQVACAMGVPRGARRWGYSSQPLTPHGVAQAVTSWGAPPDSRGVGGVDGGSSRESLRQRARQREEARVGVLVLAARREGREPEAAREAEVARMVARVVDLASGVEEVGTVLAFTFWAEQGALTLVDYREDGGGGSAARTGDAAVLERALRHVFTGYVGQRTGLGVLRLRREESRWAVEYDATRQSARPAEAKTLPVRTQGTPAHTFLAFHDLARERLRAVRVPAGGTTRVALEVRLEDGRLVDWQLREEVRHSREGIGGNTRPFSPQGTGQLVQVLLPFTEGLGPRTVHVVLRAEYRLGESEARCRVESARVERPPAVPELSWYRSMHEALLLRWREDVREGSAWLAQKGVEEAALWFAAGIAAKGAGFFATKGLEWVPRALGREPEVAAGWLRTALKRLSGEEKKALEQLWRKVALDGEQALTHSEREALRRLFVRLEQVIQQPLDDTLKRDLRNAARDYYMELYPQFADALRQLRGKLQIHHRRPMQYAHLFPAEDINAGENLAMVREHVHKEVNLLWGRFRQARPSPTADEVRRAAEIIDGHFESWYHRPSDPPGLVKTTADARDAALRELRSQFPGFDW